MSNRPMVDKIDFGPDGVVYRDAVWYSDLPDETLVKVCFINKDHSIAGNICREIEICFHFIKDSHMTMTS